MASFRLRAASGTLSARSFGLDDVYSPLDELEPIEPRFKRWVPLEIEWPEGTVDDASAGQSAPIADSPVLAQMPAKSAPAPASMAVPIPVALPVPIPVAVPAVVPAPMIKNVVATAPVSSQLVEVDGIIWDIRTTRR